MVGKCNFEHMNSPIREFSVHRRTIKASMDSSVSNRSERLRICACTKHMSDVLFFSPHIVLQKFLCQDSAVTDCIAHQEEAVGRQRNGNNSSNNNVITNFRFNFINHRSDSYCRSKLCPDRTVMTFRPPYG